MFRFVPQKGNAIIPPTFISVFASGTVHRGGVVRFREASNLVSPASSGSTHTNILGIALDYVQGASDTKSRVIPFVPGQLWEADCLNVMTTNMLFIRHALNDDLSINNTTSDVANPTGVFIAYSFPDYVFTATSNSAKVIGEFIRSPIQLGQNQSTFI